MMRMRMKMIFIAKRDNSLHMSWYIRTRFVHPRNKGWKQMAGLEKGVAKRSRSVHLFCVFRRRNSEFFRFSGSCSCNCCCRIPRNRWKVDRGDAWIAEKDRLRLLLLARSVSRPLLAMRIDRRWSCSADMNFISVCRTPPRFSLLKVLWLRYVVFKELCAFFFLEVEIFLHCCRF